MSKNQRINSTSAKGSQDRRREVFGVVGLGLALFLTVAMISLQAGAMVMGPFGRSMAGLFYSLTGACGCVLIADGAGAAIHMLLDPPPSLPAMIALGSPLCVIRLAQLIPL